MEIRAGAGGGEDAPFSYGGRDSRSAGAAGRTAARPLRGAPLDLRGSANAGRPPHRGCTSYAPLGLRRLYFLMGSVASPCPGPRRTPQRRRGRKQGLPPNFYGPLTGGVSPYEPAQSPERRAEAAAPAQRTGLPPGPGSACCPPGPADGAASSSRGTN